MSIIRRKRRIINKIKIFIIFLVIIIVAYISLKTTSRKVEIFSLKLDNSGDNIYTYNYEGYEGNVINKYNTLLISMDDIFNIIFENYDENLDNQTLTYNSTTLEIDKNSKIIKLPNVYTSDTNIIDDTVEIEIEEIDGMTYIPLYLVSNIEGLDVEIDGRNIYDKDEYINSLDIINNGKTEHNIRVVTAKTDDNKDLSDTEYVGEELGALWREEAYKRIEKYRKKDTEIVVKDKNGKLLNNATIKLQMKNNEFKFGSAVRVAEATKQNKYTNITSELFNAVGSENAFKWINIEKNGPEIANDIIKYAQENDMYVRGHYLWRDYLSDNLKSLVGSSDNIQKGTMAYINKEYKYNKSISATEAKQMLNEIKLKFEDLVLSQIENEAKQFSDINEWDVINEMLSNQFFKYYLYDKKALGDSVFLTTTTKHISTFSDNDEYYQFIAKCFDKAKQVKPNAKLCINDNKIKGDFSEVGVEETIKIIKNIKKYTNNIDAIGVQYHVGNLYKHTPQSYYNQIKKVIDQSNIGEAIITEYDNYSTSKKGKYTEEEKVEKANYLRDSLIAQYSNQNVTGFYFWVYNSGTGSFVQEEYDAYEQLMQEWMNHEESGITANDGTYSTRLHKGEYTATVSIDGYNLEVPFVVSDENDDSIEIVVNKYDKELSKVIEKYNNFENTYGEQIDKLEEVKQQLNTVKQSIQNTTYETKAEDILKILEQTYEIGNKLIGNNNVEEVENILKSIEEIGNSYKGLLELNDETIDFEVDNFESEINKINNLFEINNDLEIQNLVQLKETLLNYYNEINNSQNYMKKYNYISAKYLTDYVEKILDEKITKYINENPVTIEYSIPEEKITNQNVKVTVNKGEDTQITNDNGNNEYTFEQNGTHDFHYTRRGIEDKITATVNNIDKEPPVISGVEENKMYVNKIVTPEVKDEHLEKVELYLNDEIVPDYQENTEISTAGKYKIIATDLAENTTEVNFEIFNNENIYEDRKSKLIELYDNFNKTYTAQINNSLISELEKIRDSINNMNVYTKADTTIELLERTLNVGNKILENNNNENIQELLVGIGNICGGYEAIMQLNEEKIETDITELETKSKELDNLIEVNSDLNMEDTVDLIRLFKKYRNDIIYTENYVKKYYYIVAENLSNYINVLINNKITQYIEANPITLSYSEDINKLTRNDITVTLNKGEDTKITCNNGSNVYTFSKNGSYVFSYERRGRKGSLEAKVENIDKDSPTIKGVVDGMSYTSKRTPRVTDEHLDVVELYFNDEVVENYTVGSILKEIGKYRIVAIDLVGNVTAVNFEIREITDDELIETDYDVNNNFIKGILPNTSYEQFIKKIETTSSYIIKRDGKELSINETKALATGDILEFPNVNKSYKLIVAGDINKDGNVNAKDLVRMRRYLLEQVKFDEIETCAADTNLDGKEITAKDLVRLRVMILNSK